jgi:aminopeptidase N
MNQIPMEEVIDIPAVDFKDKEQYGIVTYLKTAIWLYSVQQAVGRENLERAMKAYFNEWKFKHPYPEDLKLILERETGKDLSSYFLLLKKKGTL